MPNERLKIGYLMQADSVPMDMVSGPQLHVKAVVQGLQQRGHEDRGHPPGPRARQQPLEAVRGAQAGVPARHGHLRR